jgi:hypothetical protein
MTWRPADVTSSSIRYLFNSLLTLLLLQNCKQQTLQAARAPAAAPSRHVEQRFATPRHSHVDRPSMPLAPPSLASCTHNLLRALQEHGSATRQAQAGSHTQALCGNISGKT